ncbi:type I-U CRISPR-associated protein Csb2 [Nocardia transvalensis]|uniref:type I-G CRISPR-associated protein Csb2 n=1 Tax=Nocardia transvalensis TaxID=37333 RepID=UPI00189335C7|nr:type I-U CRISPR-associated protein Csb2 [Nocardia transvalensis]MBF6332411.1 type I-U CRISPR-associated protein Cas5/Cas6 [Nocardia transvalensis]
MAAGIRATFLLGTYTGHRADGSPDPVPDPARLHAALLNAAGQGITAVAGKHGLEPSAQARAVLEWLENNPPTGVLLPARRPVADSPVTAFRKEGVLRKEGKAAKWVDKTTARAFSDGYALAGPVGWCWANGIPDDIRGTLEKLCADVSCLGETTSPVLLTVSEIEPTHEIAENAALFDPIGDDWRVPEPGRTAALEAGHAACTGKPPSIPRDRHSSSEMPAPAPVSRAGLGVRRYRAIAPEPSTAPWPTVVLLPTTSTIHPDRRVAWCVAIHRALVERIGFGAPPMITGHYATGLTQPANRLAIQYIPARHRKAEVLAHHGIASGAFALMIPAGAGADELAPLARALVRFQAVSLPRNDADGTYRGSVRFDDAVTVAGETFWPRPEAGRARWWVTDPVAVPETGRQRRSLAADGTRRRWSLEDAARVSVGLVFRDALGVERRGSRWFENLAANAADHGVQVRHTALMHRSDIDKWIHKAPAGHLVQPYRATLRMGRLADDTTLLAIGQSRHLGGGLLLPVDEEAIP